MLGGQSSNLTSHCTKHMNRLTCSISGRIVEILVKLPAFHMDTDQVYLSSISGSLFLQYSSQDNYWDGWGEWIWVWNDNEVWGFIVVFELTYKRSIFVDSQFWGNSIYFVKWGYYLKLHDFTLLECINLEIFKNIGWNGIYTWELKDNYIPDLAGRHERALMRGWSLGWSLNGQHTS